MPLTPFQSEVFSVLKGSRSPDSFVFGATVLQSAEQSVRYSADIDFSHDTSIAVALSAEQDGKTLQEAGYSIKWQVQRPGFFRAEVVKGKGSVVLEWVHDTAFRFFPVETDEVLGYRLHPFDAATNKILALCGRNEPRDFVDAIYLHQSFLSIGTLIWAAAAKDEGLNPYMILELADQFAHYRQSDIDALDLVSPIAIQELKRTWKSAFQSAKALFETLPAEEVGCAYLDPSTGQLVDPNPEDGTFNKLIRHRGSLHGSWPQLG